MSRQRLNHKPIGTHQKPNPNQSHFPLGIKEFPSSSLTGQEKLGAHSCHAPVVHLSKHRGERNV